MTLKPGDTLLVPFGPRARHQCIVKDVDAVCSSCGAGIIWVTTPRGKLCPIDPPADESAEIVTHWSSCPTAAQHKGAGR